jgi:hypothetical protein
MTDPVAIHYAQVGLAVFFMHPQVTEPFFVKLIKRHPIAPRFGYIGAEAEYMRAQKLQAAFGGFFLPQKIFVDGSKHGLITRG